MSGFLDTLFGLDGLGFSDPEAVFGFARPVPAWVWAIVVAVVVAIVASSYARLSVSRPVRVALASMRVVFIMVLLVVACGPELRKSNERVEPDWVVMMIDRSQSMMIADAGVRPALVSREEQLQEILGASRPVLVSIDANKRVVWLGFDSSVYELDGRLLEEPGLLGVPEGRSTAIGASMEAALQRVAARPLSAIVLFSDGQSVDAVSRAVRRSLERQRVPVYAVALGSADPISDMSIRRVVAPEVVFVDDVVTVGVEIEHRGAASGRARLQLRDAATDELVDEQEVEVAADGTATVRLSTQLSEAGGRRLTVTLIPEQDDLIADNNRAQVSVELVDRPLRVLYVDGYPRWEHRYLKTLLLRERSIRSSSLLLSANRRYLQEGDVEIDALPRSVEEWAEYDVIVIGDLRPELIGEDTLIDLRQHIAERGAGLIWASGPGAVPLAWRGTALADLLPMSLDVEQAVRVWREPVTMRRTVAAADLSLLEMSDATSATSGDAGWPEILSDHNTGWARLHWAQQIAPAAIKPGAVALATFETERGAADGTSPAVLMMRFGAGVSVYVATDETWRWRYGRGEDLSERFWVPMIRQLGRASLARGDRAVLLTASPEAALVGQPVRIGVELLDQSLIDSRASAVSVRVGSETSGVRVTLDPQADGRGRHFGGTWVPDRPGRYVVAIDDPLMPTTGEGRVVTVVWPDDESRTPQTNHELLRELAESTGGSILTADGLAQLEASLPNRAVTIAGEPEIRTLWDRPLVLVVLMVLLALEWVGRRVVRLA